MLKDYIPALRDLNEPSHEKLQKKGTLDIGIVETTPIVWKNRLYRFEWIRNNRWGNGYHANQTGRGYYRFTDMLSGGHTEPFAYDHAFGCAYTDGSEMFVVGVEGEGGGCRMNVFSSSDLLHWTKRSTFAFPDDWKLYNNSICKSDQDYIMAIEI